MDGWESTSLAGAGRGRSVEQILKIWDKRYWSICFIFDVWLDRGGVEPVELALENALLAGLAAAIKQGEQHLGRLPAFLVDGLDDRGDGRRGEVGPVFAVESQKTYLLRK